MPRLIHVEANTHVVLKEDLILKGTPYTIHKGTKGITTDSSGEKNYVSVQFNNLVVCVNLSVIDIDKDVYQYNVPIEHENEAVLLIAELVEYAGQLPQCNINEWICLQGKIADVMNRMIEYYRNYCKESVSNAGRSPKKDC